MTQTNQSSKDWCKNAITLKFINDYETLIHLIERGRAFYVIEKDPSKHSPTNSFWFKSNPKTIPSLAHHKYILVNNSCHEATKIPDAKTLTWTVMVEKQSVLAVCNNSGMIVDLISPENFALMFGRSIQLDNNINYYVVENA